MASEEPMEKQLKKVNEIQVLDALQGATLPFCKTAYSLKGAGDSSMNDDTEKAFDQVASATSEFIGEDSRSSKDMFDGQLSLDEATLNFRKEEAKFIPLKMRGDVPINDDSEQTLNEGDAAIFDYLCGRVNRSSKNMKATSYFEGERAAASTADSKEQVCDLFEQQHDFLDGSNDSNQKHQNTVEDLSRRFDEAGSNVFVRNRDDSVEDANKHCLSKFVADLDISEKTQDDGNSRQKKLKRAKKSSRKKPSSRYVKIVTVTEVVNEENSRKFDENPKTMSKNEENFADISSSSGGFATQGASNHHRPRMTDSEWAAMLEQKKSMHYVYEAAKRYLLDKLKATDEDLDYVKTVMENPDQRKKFRINKYVNDKLSYINSIEFRAKRGTADSKEFSDKVYPVDLHPYDDARLRVLYDEHTAEYDAFMEHVVESANKMRDKCSKLRPKRGMRNPRRS